MNFEEWLNGDNCKLDTRDEPILALKEAWNAAIDEAIEVINSNQSITDIEGYAIFPELAEELKELKQP